MWEARTDDVSFIPLLGEMIAAALAPGLAAGLELRDLTLNVSNVVVEARTTTRTRNRPG